MKQLEKVFTGRGQVKGFIFTQIKQNNKAFIYEVNDNNRTYYEVFKRKENTQYDCISYPSNKGFGVWAWTCMTLDKAVIKYDELSDIENN
jgi:hypothetical protein